MDAVTSPSTRTELAAAIRIVNQVYNDLDVAAQDRVEIIDFEPVEAALRADDDDRALAAVEVWSRSQLAAIREAQPVTLDATIEAKRGPHHSVTTKGGK